jgi:hypothetical protein
MAAKKSKLPIEALTSRYIEAKADYHRLGSAIFNIKHPEGRKAYNKKRNAAKKKRK